MGQARTRVRRAQSIRFALSQVRARGGGELRILNSEVIHRSRDDVVRQHGRATTDKTRAVVFGHRTGQEGEEEAYSCSTARSHQLIIVRRRRRGWSSSGDRPTVHHECCVSSSFCILLYCNFLTPTPAAGGVDGGRAKVAKVPLQH